jgi:D-3-phosphoglycerate dehydrogenase / 2-oxoglutarate reductase
MNDPVDALIVDLLEWIGPHPRPYAEVPEAWRTPCPRLPVWEEANARGYIDRMHVPGEAAHVVLSAGGRAYLRAALAQRGTRAEEAHAAS